MNDEHTTSDHPLPREPGDTEPHLSASSAAESARSGDVWAAPGGRRSSSDTTTSSLRARLGDASGRPVRLGRYEVRHLIGSGGMGDVYAAVNVERGERVALKTLRRMSGLGLLRFKQEFRSLAGVLHPNLVALHELAVEDDEWFFTMDLVDGVSFAVYTQAAEDWHARPVYLGQTFSIEDRPSLRAIEIEGPASIEGPRVRAPFHEGRLRAALRDLATGVSALHALGKVHRDLNPANVLVTPEGRVVVLDFGLICDGSQPAAQGFFGGVSGTPSYMSPEQGAGKRTGPASDWYSVGVMLFEALTGRLPFRGNAFRLLSAKQHRDAPRPSSMVSGVPRDLDDLCAALLRRAPGDRPDVAEVLGVLGATEVPRARAAVPLIGRRPEIMALEVAYRAADLGESAVVVVHGPRGSGKTALCESFVDSVAAQGALVLRGAASLRERIPHRGLDPIVDAIAVCLGSATPREASALTPPSARDLARLFPVLSDLPAITAIHATADPPRSPRDGRASATFGLAEILRRLAETAPLVVWIDDVEHAGPLDAVIDALIAPPDEGERRPLVILSGACEDGVVAGLSRARGVRLDPISSADACELAGLVMRKEGRRAPSVARAAEGNPRLVVDLASFAAETGRAEVSIEAMIEAQLTRLPGPALRLAEVLATARGPIPQAVALDVAGVASVGSSAILRLNNARIAHPSGPEGDDPIELEHRARAVITRRRTPELHRRAHADLATALARWPGADHALVAAHFAEGGQPALAASHAELAASRASRAGDPDRAADLLARAIEWARIGDPKRAEALASRRAEALADAGRPAEAARAFLGAVSAAPLARALDLRRRAAELLLVSGRVEEGVALQKSVLVAHGLRWPETPREALFRLAAGLVKLRLRGTLIPAWAESQASPNARARIDAAWSVGKGLSPIDPIRSSVFMVDALLAALTEGDVALAARGGAFVGCLHAYGGSAADELRGNDMIEDASRVAHRIGDAYLIGFTRCCSGLSRMCVGSFREAIARVDEGFAALAARGGAFLWERHAQRTIVAQARFALGALEDRARAAERHVAEARTMGDHFGEVEATLAMALTWIAQGQPKIGREEAQRAVSRFYAQSFTLQHNVALWTEVSSLLYEGAPGAAWARLERSAPAQKRSHILRIQLARIDALLLRGVTAASLAAIDRSRADDLLTIADAAAASLAGERRVHAIAGASVVRAAAMRARGAVPRAIDHLHAAAVDYASVEMKIHAACARRAAGALMGGPDGEALALRAGEALRAEGIVDPARWTRMYTGILG